ncbi:hypothetical protein OM076_14970 [Solirubrobacter ginsenosidimutans]|uniref:Uncharacterized protein n=1 Tax=Solirubrobacter ginsenosidimutans TaxID=490573 RepID=A0A9X3MSI3_9ACTN|nr:hypothetical protein [Solirubrobacter ginsenosidimutans]MDA0161577.1 hypothetical protein [Solirubrobacter ginsenosidimutans]
MRTAAAVALIVLTGRALAYALVDDPLAHATGGPELPLIALISGALALAIAAAVLWLAALGVNERRLLEPRARAPRLRLTTLPRKAATHFTASALVFTVLESYLHARAGLGLHGLSCLLGPVHRDALPILASLAVIATALGAALDHVIAWMRRTIAALRRDRRPAPKRRAVPTFAYTASPGRAPSRPHGARGPPVVVA